MSVDNFLKLEVGSGALVVVAHPDDETIWMGGTILMNPLIKWTIFSLCRSNDLDRAPRFKKACEYYGARAIISDLEDEDVMNIRESVPKIEKQIKEILKPFSSKHSLRSASQKLQRGEQAQGITGHGFAQGIDQRFDYIFTHGANGEYGHPRHKGVYKAISNLAIGNWFKIENCFLFDYKFDEKKGSAVPNERASMTVNLPEKIFAAKLKVIEKIYGFQKNSFEYKSCASKETFTVIEWE